MRAYTRQFDRPALSVDTFTDQWAQEVLAGIENDTLKVFSPSDDGALNDDLDESGAVVLEARATVPVSIKEWLPVACQFIRVETAAEERRLGSRRDKRVLAYYLTNACEVLWPEEIDEPAGPAALIAGIVLTNEFHRACLRKRGVVELGLKHVIAHELVHVFDAMRYVVPAFMDWEAFGDKMLADRTRCGLLISLLNEKGVFVDDYGKQNELAMIEAYWPSHARQWFDGRSEIAV
jgi:hypothetical protein